MEIVLWQIIENIKWVTADSVCALNAVKQSHIEMACAVKTSVAQSAAPRCCVKARSTISFSCKNKRKNRLSSITFLGD